MDGVIALAIILVACFVLAIVPCAIVNAIQDHIEAKRKKAHPHLWMLFDECEEAGHDECRWYNENIALLKNKIDAILRDWDYYSADLRAKKEKELESLRERIELAEMPYREKCRRTEAIRTEIREYVAQHDLKWAKKWGW
jgi:hypothetical protein